MVATIHKGKKIETAMSAKAGTGIFSKRCLSTSYCKRNKLLALGSTPGMLEVIIVTVGHVAFHGRIKNCNFWKIIIMCLYYFPSLLSLSLYIPSCLTFVYLINNSNSACITLNLWSYLLFSCVPNTLSCLAVWIYSDIKQQNPHTSILYSKS